MQYYLASADHSGRYAKHPYIGAPDPHVFTVAPKPDPEDPSDPDDTTAIVDFDVMAYTVVPNPASGSFVVTTPNATELALFNAMGQVVLQQNIKGEDMLVVNAANWKAGIYIVAIVTESGKVVQRKVIIQ